MSIRFLVVLLAPVCWAQFGNVAIHFEANQGQFPTPIQFAGPGLTLAPGEARFSVAEDRTVRMAVEGGDAAARMEGLERLPGESNYFIGGDPKTWKTHVPHFSKVRERNVYPGIDLIYYGKGRQLEFDFVVAPGADPGAIRIRFDDAKLRLQANGDLLVDAVRLEKPVVYQEVDGVRSAVDGRYSIDDRRRVRFLLGDYDPSRTLIIDPVLSYSTLLNGTDAVGAGIAVDEAGNVYITGNTNNGFQTVNGFQPSFGSGRAAFVAKFNPAGTVLLYSTFLGGSTTETGALPGNVAMRIAVDRTGNAYVVGSTTSVSFPVTPGCAQPINRGGEDLFVTKLNPTGSALIYSTYLGGNQNENGQAGYLGIAVDAAGSAYVTGGTASRNFPVTNGALQPAYGGGATDAFVSKLDVLGSTLVYSTYLGSPAVEAGTAIAVDSAGNAYIAGMAESGGVPPRAGALQATFGGGLNDVFVSKLNAVGNGLLYSTYLGGSGGDAAFSIAVDSVGNAYVAGVTDSPNFPVSAQAFRKTAAGGDAFVSKINPGGSALVYSTLIGGSRDDIAYSVAVDSQGSAVVVGGTESPDFSITRDAFQSGLGLLRRGAGRTAPSGFLTKVNAGGTALTYSTYFGGNNGESVTSVALDASGNAYLTGVATSINFPRTSSNYEPPDRSAFRTVFLAKFDLGSRSSMALGSVVSAATYQIGINGAIAPGQIVVLFGNEIGPAELTTLRLTADGKVDTILAGVRVLFDGVPAPLLYVSAKQLSAVVPYGVPPNGRTVVQVDYQGLRSNPLVLWVQPALVGIFSQDGSGRGPGAILNQDGTVNSPSNPAAKGSIVVLYGTGEGRTQPEGVDGRVAAEPLPRPVLRIFAQISDRATEVLYVGGAPGLVAGVLQMNIRVPETAPSGPAIPIFIGGMDGPFGVEPSERATLSIR